MPDPDAQDHEPRGGADRILLAVVACFVASGAGGLVLEVAWTRMLRLAFGSTTLAISTVLVAYMLGLGFGGLTAGRLATRVRNGVRAYGWVELCIGVYALFAPTLLGWIPEIGAAWLYGLDFGAASLVRFALALVLLIFPTFCMGATLPLLVRAIVPEEDGQAGRRIGLLYGLNTLGAVAGVLLTSYALFPLLGLRGASYFGAGLELAVGALALIFIAPRVGATPTASTKPTASTASTEPTVSTEPTASTEPAAVPSTREGHGLRFGRWLPLLAYGAVGFTALVYEVSWSRALSMVMGSSIYAFSSMLAAFLLGIALGSVLIGTRLQRLRDPYLVYALGIALLGLLALLTIFLLPRLPSVFTFWVGTFGVQTGWLIAVQLVLSILVMLPPALVLGALFPLLAGVLAEDENASTATGDVYFVNTIGSAAGAFAAGFFLIPNLGLRGTLGAAVALNLAVAAVLLLGSGKARLGRRAPLAAVAALAAVVIAIYPPPLNPQALAEGAFQSDRLYQAAVKPSEYLIGVRGMELLFYRDGINTSVSVHEYGGSFSLHVNGKVDGSSTDDMPTQVLSGQVGILFGKAPETVLVIGWATGVTVGSVARSPVEQIDAVELEPAIMEASHFFDHVNGRPLEDPRVRVILDDGRTHLSYGRDRYDVIISEPSNPWMTGVSDLFTTEFFHAARAALRPGGRLLQWLPAYGIDWEEMNSILAALRSEFPYVYGFAINRQMPDLLLVASLEEFSIDSLPRFESLPAPIRKDLERVDIYSTAQLWSLLRLLPEEVDALASRARVANSDDNLRVELRTPWTMYSGIREQNWAFTSEFNTGILPLLENSPGAVDPEFIGELAIAYLRRNMRGVSETLMQRAPQAAHTIVARALVARARGEFDAVGLLARFDAALEEQPDAHELRVRRAQVRLSIEQPEPALEDASIALVQQPDDPRAIEVRAVALMGLGRLEEA
ncbi:MAG: fused MFS/spermidine synthase, partial [Myxococcales bacterium]|nr:fused MFS/spermidine synthase [Myxococcales bacterium]